MFLDVTMRRNSQLIEAAIKLHQAGKIEPDTYVLDLDAILANAAVIKQEADRLRISLFFMTKQLGRNPFIASHLLELGYRGAVAVDFREADCLAENGIPLAHVGHLVQIPSRRIESILRFRPEYVTVYSVEKAREVSQAAGRLGLDQKILLRVVGPQDVFFPGQYGGIPQQELDAAVDQILALPHVRISGVTSFPCLQFDDRKGELEITPNLYTIMAAKQALQDRKLPVKVLNAPAATCCGAMTKLATFGVTHGEPGHGLLGTTPLHAVKNQPELPAMIYVSEVSHSAGNKTYCYGGGHYRRSGVTQALIGPTAEMMKLAQVEMPEPEHIDYYFATERMGNAGDTVIMAFRTQIFVTRSRVAVVKGIQQGYPSLVGIYESNGKV